MGSNEELRRLCQELVALPPQERSGDVPMRMFLRFDDLAGPPEVLAILEAHAALLARAEAAEADAARLRAALTATMQRTTGYDWNADPDNITLLQSEALHV